MGNIVTKDVEEVWVVNAFFTSVFDSKNCYPQGSWLPGLVDRDWEQNILSAIREEAASDLLWQLDAHKSMELDEICPRSLGKLAEEFTKMISFIYHLSWLTKEIPDDWSLANVTPFPKKAWEEDLGSCKHVHLNFTIIEQCRWRMTSKDCLVQPFVGKEV